MVDDVIEDEDRSKFSFGMGYKEYKNTLKTKTEKMKHYAQSVPKPKTKELPKYDLSKLEKLPGTHILPPIKEERYISAEKMKKR